MRCFVLSWILIIAQPSFGQLCQNWAQAQKVSLLDHEIISESSGLAVSKLVEGRFYHINGSGDDAEAIAVHPTNGTIFLLTKEIDFDNRRSSPAQLFKVEKENLVTDTESPILFVKCLEEDK